MAIVSVANAFAAGVDVSPTNTGYISHAITANMLKPSGCTQNLTHIVRGAGVINGTENNDLIIGSAASDTISGGGGNDCILGGGGDDVIDGGDGTDVCYGGYGTDSFTNCEAEIQ
mgnify:FL=1